MCTIAVEEAASQELKSSPGVASSPLLSLASRQNPAGQWSVGLLGKYLPNYDFFLVLISEFEFLLETLFLAPQGALQVCSNQLLIT